MRPASSFVNQPIRSLQTMLKTIRFEYPDIPPVIPDGIYGPQTIQAISVFQRREGLPITGITNRQTWEAISRCYRHAKTNQARAEPVRIILNPCQIIQDGNFNRNMYLVQAMLTVLALDYPAIPVPSFNGILDLETAESIRAFQVLSGLRGTGELDKITWKNLALQYTLAANRGSSGCR